MPKKQKILVWIVGIALSLPMFNSQAFATTSEIVDLSKAKSITIYEWTDPTLYELTYTIDELKNGVEWRIPDEMYYFSVDLGNNTFTSKAKFSRRVYYANAKNNIAGVRINGLEGYTESVVWASKLVDYSPVIRNIEAILGNNLTNWPYSTYPVDDNFITVQFEAISNAANQAPDVTNATPSIDNIWPPNKKMIPITINNVIDPDEDPVTIKITGITQDEAVGKIADANGIGTDTAWVRAERNENGNGRVYKITFIATDDKGESTEGHVYVNVPHDKGTNGSAVDDGQAYDSTLAE
ncbi:hypothetical protein CN679_28310 [Bacillus pseudomycoides]|uniref:hypothetical protein n=1 Tax=Bacillus pseudomycoides TaxID=64104 RepID=UPI000BEFDA29|nr:hypothetical protein [Bacillus pseudomycoides]PEI82067.1 hypothetical protein CN679_28310 [Bacillus pseudomycoides]